VTVDNIVEAIVIYIERNRQPMQTELVINLPVNEKSDWGTLVPRINVENAVAGG
jgi:hypothetical protein